jgi:hypothetical protein
MDNLCQYAYQDFHFANPQIKVPNLFGFQDTRVINVRIGNSRKTHIEFSTGWNNLSHSIFDANVWIESFPDSWFPGMMRRGVIRIRDKWNEKEMNCSK